MQLSQDNIDLFYKLHPALLFYVNEKLCILSDRVQTPNELIQLGIDKTGEVRKKLWENTELIDDFVAENPFGFSQEELAIISNWKKHYIRKWFFIIKYSKKYAIFLDSKEPTKAYGVKALISPFEDVIGDDLPLMVDAVLLPFKEWIIYDGFLFSKKISFGGGIKADLNEELKIAKAEFGIIESLPYDRNREKTEDAAEKLKRCLKTETSREHFSEEIYDLIQKNRELKIIYHQEMGKIDARSYKKDLRDIEILNGWFGILQGILVAGGGTKKELDNAIKIIVPPKKQDLVFRFQMREKK